MRFWKRLTSPRREFTKKRKTNQRGFTLLETSIALCIMFVVTLATASLFVYAVNYNSGAADRSAALAIAQQRLERLRKSSFSDSLLTTPSTSETVLNAGRPYSVQTTICTTSDCGGSPTLKLITVSVSPQAATQWANAAVTITSQRAMPGTGSYEAK
jgi:Tfp pilus assembly protein PilV